MTALAAKAPWYVSGTRTRHNAMPVLQIISEPTGEVLALVPYSDRNTTAHAECYADAHLLAAAPELLAVVREALADANENGYQMIANWQDAAAAAIAKAEGKK